jgi:hypothetical protein
MNPGDDEELRKLERLAAQGDPAARKAYRAACLRVGIGLDPAQFERLPLTRCPSFGKIRSLHGRTDVVGRRQGQRVGPYDCADCGEPHEWVLVTRCRSCDRRRTDVTSGSCADCTASLAQAMKTYGPTSRMWD